MVVIDTSVLIAAGRGQINLPTTQGGMEEDLATAAICVSELSQGIHRAGTVRRRTAREAQLAYVLRSLRVLPFDLETARLHGQLWADLSSRGIQLGAHDLIIAATALYHNARLATRDKRSFPKIKGLAVEYW